MPNSLPVKFYRFTTAISLQDFLPKVKGKIEKRIQDHKENPRCSEAEEWIY